MFITTARRHLEATRIAASARQFKEDVQEKLVTLLAARLREGETMPDLAFFQELVGRLLDDNGSSVMNLDGTYTSQLVGAAALRAQRNELSRNIRLRLRDVRYLLERSVDGGVFKAALRERRLSKVKPVSLLQGARDLVTALRDPKVAVGAADSAVAASAATFAAALEAEASELELVLAQLSPQKLESQDQLGSKVADLQAAAETNKRCIDLLYGLYRVVGLDYHAERLRAKARRKPMEEPEKEAPPPEPSTALVSIN